MAPAWSSGLFSVHHPGGWNVNFFVFHSEPIQKQYGTIPGQENMSGNWNSPPKPTNYENMRKPRKTTGNLMSDRIFDFKYSNFPCWRMCAVSRGVRGCPSYMVRSTLLLFSGLPFRGRVIWPSGGVQHFSMELSSWAWFLRSISNCSYLYIPNLRFSNSSKNKHISNIIFTYSQIRIRAAPREKLMTLRSKNH